MIDSCHHSIQKKPEDVEDLLYDLSYDDMDIFVRSCGVILTETRLKEINY